MDPDKHVNSLDEVMATLQALTLDEIRQELINRGENIGPTMPTMRNIFQKKLARCILRERGIDHVEQTAISKPEVRVEKSITPTKTTNTGPYYAVSLPKDETKQSDQDLVFDDKKLAMAFMKTIKGSRFKIFKDRESAMCFTRLSVEQFGASPKPSIEPRLESYENANTPSCAKPETKIGERPRSFREPSRAERIKLKTAVETGDVDTVTSLIWSNPHFLISVGESPVVLHEALRYNALHLAAKHNQAEVCRVILAAITDRDFHELLCPEDTDETRKDRIDHLLDLLLNMPDKGGGDSALHFACKYGSVDVVEILVRYPTCDRYKKNKRGSTPVDVVDERATKPDAQRRERIIKLLRDSAYVPLYRGFQSQPVVGRPVTEGILGNNHEIKAYAGPMSPEKAEQFYRSWTHCPLNSPKHVLAKIRETKSSDYDKGLERLGRDLAEECDVGWNEYWDFLSDYANFRTPAGLQALEQYLTKRASCDDADVNRNFVEYFENDRLLFNNGHDPFVNSSDAQKFSQTGDGSKMECEAGVKEECCFGLGCQTNDVELPHGSPNASVSPAGGGASPGDVSLLATKFADLRLESPSDERRRGNVGAGRGSDVARLFLSFDSDGDSCSDSESDYYSAPSSPIEATKSLVSLMDWNEATNSVSDDSDENYFDAEDQVPNFFPCLRTPLQRFVLPRRLQGHVFLDGAIPTKLDLDVLRAVGVVSVKADVYPQFTKWRQAVSSYTAAERDSWPSPGRIKRFYKQYLQSPLALPSPGRTPRPFTPNGKTTPATKEHQSTSTPKYFGVRSKLEFTD